MNYEKAYKAVLSTAKQWIKDGCTDKERICLECVFPELRESEEEQALRIIRNRMCYDPAPISDEDRRIVENWLEKQKENPKSADSIPADCVSDAKCEDRWHKVADSMPDNPREVLCKDEAGNYFIGRYYVGEGWEISNYDAEDKPHHLNPPVSKWIDFPSEKQKEPHYTKRNALFDKCVENCDPEVMEEVSDKVDEMLGKEQKPNIELIQRSWYMEGYHDREFGKEPKWVIKTGEGGPKHELNPRYGQPLAEQKPAEWSEEDDAMRDNILRVLNCFVGTAECESTPSLSTSYPLYRREIDWLKSLRSRPSWKPSEEQIYSLGAVVKGYNECAVGSVGYHLKEMYEQLKKLM